MSHTHLSSTCIRIAVLLSTSALLLLVFCAAALGQGSTPQRGFQPGASYALSDIETINTTNGNLMLNLPLGQLPAGRGGLSGQLNLHYDSKLYDSKTQWYQDFDHLVGGEPYVVIRNMLSVLIRVLGPESKKSIVLEELRRESEGLPSASVAENHIRRLERELIS